MVQLGLKSFGWIVVRIVVQSAVAAARAAFAGRPLRFIA
jgi:hypothetical protein